MENPYQQNWQASRERVGWSPLNETAAETYRRIGFKCGLEVHQQLLTARKLFCRCPAGIYHDFDNFDAEIVRHMRPTLSELGEYDGTALMEFKTRKKIVYRIKNDSACTYEVDDTPPFPMNREALSHAMQIALLLKIKIVGELHLTRKQYLDGSIPTGFQRTTILGIEGEFPISNKTIRVIQFSIEEDSCREVSDLRHTRVYYGDRLGMPLVETVTYPDMLTPYEAAEAAQHIRFICRSSGKVRTGIGAAREDVNVSVTGGTRVEIKGVAHIRWIPKLTHNEAFRQVALLSMMSDLKAKKIENWKLTSQILKLEDFKHVPIPETALAEGWKLIGINLPQFKNLLSFFTSPGRCFADEISDRLKVIACLEKPNMLHSEELLPNLPQSAWDVLKKLLGGGEDDAQIIFWAPDEDIKTAIETIEERCNLAFKGVPNETRKSLPDGTTLFERVLPGADRMYPDTDSAPIPIGDEMIESARANLPTGLQDRLNQLKQWDVPRDAYTYILRNNLMPVIEKLASEHLLPERFLALLYAHHLKSLQGYRDLPFDHGRINDLLRFAKNRNLALDILPAMLKVLFENPNMQFSSILEVLGFRETPREEIFAQIPVLISMFSRIKRVRYLEMEDRAMLKWIMGRLRKPALGNIPLVELSQYVKHLREENHA
ncbi:MAG: Glu-tRNA(Gln) amidotransferase subunit GatE [Candidatus Cloacimonadaceae bacterium]|nr:Glu-tRNA(Gln) amidotransferase subunit GatE [Candidatus Cloacimonadaceae bacterium]